MKSPCCSTSSRVAFKSVTNRGAQIVHQCTRCETFFLEDQRAPAGPVPPTLGSVAGVAHTYTDADDNAHDLCYHCPHTRAEHSGGTGSCNTGGCPCLNFSPEEDYQTCPCNGNGCARCEGD